MPRTKRGMVIAVCRVAPAPAIPDRDEDGEIWSGVVEAKTMTVTNLLEVVVVLAILYVAYRFYQKRG